MTMIKMMMMMMMTTTTTTTMISCQIPLAKSTSVSFGLLRWMTPMGCYHQGVFEHPTLNAGQTGPFLDTARPKLIQKGNLSSPELFMGCLLHLHISQSLPTLAFAMHCPAARRPPRQPRGPGPPGRAQSRRSATQGAAGCHRQRHGKALRGVFQVTICDASNTVI